jgi:hypothetical protein
MEAISLVTLGLLKSDGLGEWFFFTPVRYDAAGAASGSFSAIDLTCPQIVPPAPRSAAAS